MKHYTSIETLPIFNYFKCTEGDFKYLYKCDDYTETPKVSADLIKSWDKIQEQYSNAYNIQEVKEIRMKMYRVMRLEKKLIDLHTCITILNIQYDEEVHDILKKMRLNYNPEDKKVSIKVLEGELKNIGNKIIELRKEFDIEDGDKPNLYKSIMEIQKALSISVDPHKTPTILYIEYMKEFNRVAKQQKISE